MINNLNGTVGEKIESHNTNSISKIFILAQAIALSVSLALSPLAEAKVNWSTVEDEISEIMDYNPPNNTDDLNYSNRIFSIYEKKYGKVSLKDRDMVMKYIDNEYYNKFEGTSNYEKENERIRENMKRLGFTKDDTNNTAENKEETNEAHNKALTEYHNRLERNKRDRMKVELMKKHSMGDNESIDDYLDRINKIYEKENK